MWCVGGAQGGGVGRGEGRGVGAVVFVGTAVGAFVACKILLCRSSSAGARAAFPRKNCRGTSAGVDTPSRTDDPAHTWPNQTRRPINNGGMDFWCCGYDSSAVIESIRARSGVVLNDVAREHLGSSLRGHANNCESTRRACAKGRPTRHDCEVVHAGERSEEITPKK